MAFDIATYVPGDAWTSPDFLTRALALPNFSSTAATNGDTTDESYFEFRGPGAQGEKFVEASVIVASGAPTFTVYVERSSDDGATWGTVEILTEAGTAERTVRYNSFAKLRLRAVSLAGGTLTMKLYQSR